MNYILDTNVLSELVSVQPNPHVIAWIEKVDPDQVFLSVVAIGELKKGIEKLPDSRRKENLDQWLREDLLIRFDGHILLVDTETMLLWGIILAQVESKGRPISAIDAILAATTKQHHAVLVTRNTTHFENTGIPFINPWDE